MELTAYQTVGYDSGHRNISRDVWKGLFAFDWASKVKILEWYGFGKPYLVENNATGGRKARRVTAGCNGAIPKKDSKCEEESELRKMLRPSHRGQVK